MVDGPWQLTFILLLNFLFCIQLLKHPESRPLSTRLWTMDNRLWTIQYPILHLKLAIGHVGELVVVRDNHKRLAHLVAEVKK